MSCIMRVTVVILVITIGQTHINIFIDLVLGILWFDMLIFYFFYYGNIIYDKSVSTVNIQYMNTWVDHRIINTIAYVGDCITSENFWEFFWLEFIVSINDRHLRLHSLCLHWFIFRCDLFSRIRYYVVVKSVSIYYLCGGGTCFLSMKTMKSCILGCKIQ